MGVMASQQRLKSRRRAATEGLHLAIKAAPGTKRSIKSGP